MEYCEVPAYVSSPCDFCYIMPDDSMSVCRIFKGDLLCFCAADSVEPGTIAAVVVDGEIYIRKVYLLEEGEYVLLCSYGGQEKNKADGLYSPEDVQIVGRLVSSHHYFSPPAESTDDGCKSVTSAEIALVTK